MRRLRAWHRNTAKRLIKSPKVHLLDTGLAATLADLTAADWLGVRHRMGYLLESFVVQQLIAQAAWTDPDLRVWHYRDKDQVEVDLVVTRGRKVWGLEVKAAGTLAAGDGRGLVRLAERCGEDFQQGLRALRGRGSAAVGRQAHAGGATERAVGAIGITVQPLRIHERNHVERPLLDQLAGLG